VKPEPKPALGAPQIDAFCLGPYQTNCYVIHGESPGGDPACWVADFSFEIETLLDHLGQRSLIPEALVLTHAHVDHIAGLSAAKRRFPDAPIMIHEAEREWLTDANLNLSGFSPTPVTAPPADRLIAEGDELTLAGRSWRVLHTPGHSPGSVSLYCADAGICVCGDAIFKGSIGRTDFPGCSFEALERSIREKLYALPDDTVLLPGHGPATSVGDEKASNPFVPG
jgi:hydroxyacylglutathione hydrolase